ncbi:hypothetical protein OSTOST_26076 [Ostertagia ostertagi]
MASLRGRLRKARKRITACYFPLSRRSRKISNDADVYVSAAGSCQHHPHYQSPSEVGQSCRGSINLQEARILSDKITNNIVISASSQTFHLKAGNDVDRQKWLSALEYSRHKAIRQAESDEDEDAHIGTGESHKHGDELIRCVNEPEIDRKTLSERAALLKV